MDAADIRRFATFANRLADASGAVVAPYFRSAIRPEDKSDLSPVTIADREAELAIRRLIEAELPDHGIVGEEYGAVRADAEWVWWLDPIDGTRAFISGSPLFGTLIGLSHRGRPVLGVIDQPWLKERWVGGVGLPATLNGEPARTRPCASLAEATLRTTSPEMFKEEAERAAFDRLRAAVKGTNYGGDCYGYALVASGFGDMVVEAGLQVHDYMAIVPVVEAAGGSVSDWHGRPMTPTSGGRIVIAGDARIHGPAVRLLAG